MLAVLEEGLFPVLHLHDDVLACVGLAADVVDERTVLVMDCRLLLVGERDAGDAPLSLKQIVEEAVQQRL